MADNKDMKFLTPCIISERMGAIVHGTALAALIEALHQGHVPGEEL